MEESKMIATPSRTKEILTQFDLRAKKGLGQNFLVDPMLVKRCAQEAQCKGAVIEIGPGLGALTEALALTARHVTCYEVDPDMVKVLHSTLASYDNVEIVLQDFLHADIDAKIKELYRTYGKVSVCANLPYYITTPVLFKLFEQPLLTYLTVMVQKEVGERFAAAPGEAQYSALTAEGQYLYEIRKLFNVPGRSFNPSPTVDSIILQFVRKKESPQDVRDFFAFIRGCFGQRRKTILNNLKNNLGMSSAQALASLKKTGIKESVRPQQLHVDTLFLLFQAAQEIRKI